jgi:hypothetical protein
MENEMNRSINIKSSRTASSLPAETRSRFRQVVAFRGEAEKQDSDGDQ